MKTIKSIFGIFILSAFLGTTAFAQTDQDIEVDKEVETEKGEAEYSYEEEKENGEVEKDADYYSETDTEQRDSETEIEHESETKGEKSSGLTQEDLDRKAEKATSGQDDMEHSQDGQSQDSKYLGAADAQNKTEIEVEELPNEVTEGVTESEYANWTISRVYEISPEDSKATRDDMSSEQESGSEDYAQEQGDDEVLYEIHFMNPEDNQIESQRFDEKGNAR